MLSKKAALLFLCTSPLAIAVFFGALYIYDPLSIFHMPYSRELTFISNMREQGIALIRHMRFDSVIMGNSYTQNTSCREAGEQLGGRFINLSMAGSSLYERSFVLEHVLRNHEIKTVFGVLTENSTREGHGASSPSEWSFLYDDALFNDFKVYFNRRYIGCLAQWSHARACIGRNTDADRPGAWFEILPHASRFGGIENWIMYHENNQLAHLLHDVLPEKADKPVVRFEENIAPEVAMPIRAAIDEFIVRPAREYPATNFIYFFNPNALLGRAIQARGNGLNVHAFWVREATLRCAALRNVQLYFFDNELFTEAIQYYKDITHYSQSINSLILQSVRLGKNRLTPDNVEAQLNLLAERVAAYDIKMLNEYIQEGIRRMNANAALKNQPLR